MSSDFTKPALKLYDDLFPNRVANSRRDRRKMEIIQSALVKAENWGTQVRFTVVEEDVEKRLQEYRGEV